MLLLLSSPSDVISIPSSNNCALLSSSLSPKSPVIAFDTLGGRGTFPNGPDVLAINVYKSGGVSTTANIILRWSEAQA